MIFSKIVIALHKIIEKLEIINTNNTLILQKIYPVGGLYFSTLSTNPNTILGFGTWSIFGAGKTLVSVNSADADFNTVEKVGGAKTVALTTGQLPLHQHNIRIQWHDTASTVNTLMAGATATSAGGANGNAGIDRAGSLTGTTGSGSPHNNLQPYITIYIWKRTV